MKFARFASIHTLIKTLKEIAPFILTSMKKKEKRLRSFKFNFDLCKSLDLLYLFVSHTLKRY